VPKKRGKDHGTLAKILVSLLPVKAPQPPVHQRGKAPLAGFSVKRETHAIACTAFLFTSVL
jgi:hypothetical protein